MSKLGVGSASAIVIANMVGVGVFTTSGFAIADLGSREWVIAAWALGGVIALCGATCYAALAKLIPEAGGEFTYLTRMNSPAMGFVAGWLSILAGFSVPIALAAMSFEAYLVMDLSGVSSGWVASSLIIGTGLAHGLNRNAGVLLQNAAVIVKLIFMVLFTVFAIWVFAHTGPVAPGGADLPVSVGPSAFDFGAVVVWISYAYTGWNAAVYIAEDIEEPSRKLPHALIVGCTIVTLLYIGLNTSFIYSLSIEEASGQLAIAALSAKALGGPYLESAMTLLVVLALFTSVLSLQMAGPRVIAKMARDRILPPVLATSSETPTLAVFFQSVIAIVCVWVAAFTDLLSYAGLALGLCSTLVVIGLVRTRVRLGGRRVPIPGYPWVPGFFISASLLIMVLSVLRDSLVAIGGLVTVLIGYAAYVLQTRLQDNVRLANKELTDAGVSK